jgi:hypothetical protein
MNRLFAGSLCLLLLAGAFSVSASSEYRQVLVADPLPLGSQATFFVYPNGLNGQQLRGERKNWRTGVSEYFTLDLPAHDRKNGLRRYTLASNAKGVWLAGAAVMLLEPDGKTYRAELPVGEVPDRGMTAYEEGGEVVAVGLDDGSLLVLHKLRGDDKGKAFRVRLQGLLSKELSIQPLTSAPKFNYGIAAVKLADGRVLMTGGYTSQNQAWLYDPRRDTWEPTGNMSVGRMYMGLAALPDGRAFVAGSSWISGASDSNSVRLGVVYGAELWDPRTGLWTALPSLPLSFKVTAHHATGPSAAVLPDGSLVVGGGLHRHVVLLRARGKEFASHWTVAGSLPEQRVSGIVQALGNNEVVVSGGLGMTPSDQCCWSREGGDRLVWQRDGEERAESLSLDRADAVVAHRGQLSFAAGGWESFHMSFAATQASAVAELIDHRNQRVRALPPLPYPLLAGRAIWLDDDRVLVKAVSHSTRYEQSFRGMDGRSLEADSSGFLAIYSRRQSDWSILDDPRLALADLAGAVNNEAILVGTDAKVWAVALADFAVREFPRMVNARAGGVSRIVADGRIVVAGGNAQAGTIEAIDADCRRADCPVSNFGYGGLQPSRRHEIFNPATDRWQLSAESQGAGESAVIRPDGRVVTLGLVTANSPGSQEASGPDRNRWLVEESNSAGTGWRDLVLPVVESDATKRGDAYCGEDNSVRKCMLLLGEHPGLPGGMVFLLQWRWDYKTRSQRHDLWVMSDETKQWTAVAKDQTVEQLRTGNFPLRRFEGKTLFGAQFALNKVRLWIE